jgi:D-ribose pyranase
VDGIPTVQQMLTALRPNFNIGEIFMAQEFLDNNTPQVREEFARGAAGIPIHFEAHIDLKQRVPAAIGLIRTGDTIQYANMILVSA